VKGKSKTVYQVFTGHNAVFGRDPFERNKAVLMDTSTRVLDLNKIQPQTLKNAIDPQDSNPLGPDW
jgi:hypothetical protein